MTSFLRVLRSPIQMTRPALALHVMEQHRITVVKANGRSDAGIPHVQEPSEI